MGQEVNNARVFQLSCSHPVSPLFEVTKLLKKHVQKSTCIPASHLSLLSAEYVVNT